MNEAFIPYALSFLNVPYCWGGKNPLVGLDCSGLVCELLRGMGKLDENQNFNAQGLFDHFLAQRTQKPLGPGCLLFYGRSTVVVSHVGLLLWGETMIGSCHGDETVISKEIAAQKGAFVKLRPYLYRKDYLTYLSLD